MTDFEKYKQSYVLEKAFEDIRLGYSVGSYDSDVIFFKHLTRSDYIQYQKKYIEYYESAQKKGLSTRAESEQRIISDGFWTQEEQNALDVQQKFVDGIRANLAKLAIPSQIAAQEKRLKEESAKLKKLSDAKIELMDTATCESYANEKANNYYIYLTLYKDKNFQEKFFEEEQFEELSKTEIFLYGAIQSDATQYLSTETIKKIACSHSFSNLYSLCSRDSYKFFGKAVADFSFYQSQLASYASMYDNIFENYSDIPDDVRDDPERVVQFAKARAEGKRVAEKAASKGGAVGVVGAKKSDLKAMGLDGGDTMTMTQMAKQKGRNLKTEDFV